MSKKGIFSNVFSEGMRGKFSERPKFNPPTKKDIKKFFYEDIKKFFYDIIIFFWGLIKGMGEAFNTFFCSLLSEKPKRNSNASTSELPNNKSKTARNSKAFIGELPNDPNPKPPTNKYNTKNLQCTGGWIVWGTILMLFFILALSYGWGAILGFFIFMAIMPLSKICYNFFIGSTKSKPVRNSKAFIEELPNDPNPKPNNNSNNDIITKKVKKMSSNLGSKGAKFYYFVLLIVLICIIGVSIKLGVLSKNW